VHAAFLTHGYPRWDGDIAGVFLERLAVALVERGHRVTVLAPSDAGQGGEELRHGVLVRRVRYAPARSETLAYRGTMVASARTPGGAIAAGMLTARIAIAGGAVDADVLHAHWWVPSGVCAWLASVFSGIPYLVTLHGTDVAVLERSSAARTLARHVLGHAGAVTAVSPQVARRAAAAVGREPSAFVVQPMPVDTERFHRPSAGGGGIVGVGRLTEQKRFVSAVRAVARLHQAGRHVSLTLIGDGPERGALEAEATQLGVAGAVRFLGQVDPARLPAAIADADVFVLPAREEGLGLAAVEALLLGIPVIAAEDGGGLLDVVPRSGAGRVVPVDDADLFAAALSDLLNPSARSLALAEGDRLRERFGAGHVAERFEGIYQEIAPQAGRDAAR
jgi:glycosyltransferase involved in cell wall biosynthesis